MISFEIVGVPAPQGSKTRMPNGAMLDGKSTEARKRHQDWRTTVAQVAKDVADTTQGAPLDGALFVAVDFRFAMPGSRRIADRRRGICFKTSAPDSDKLMRALGDGLQAGGLIRDDARFAVVLVRKLELWGSWTGAVVRIERLSDDPTLPMPFDLDRELMS